MPLRLTPTFRDALAAAGPHPRHPGAPGSSGRPLAGIWVCSGSPLVAEIVAGSGIDWLLIDMEHSPNGLESVLTQLQAIAAYPATPLVRVPTNDVVTIKQVLDLGAQNLLVPMVSSRADAEAAVHAVRYPPHGTRGVGSALARSARWNRVDDYLHNADTHLSLFVQIETTTGVDNAAEIAAVDGIDGIFIGPSDLAASMGLLGQQTHPDVITAALHTLHAAHTAGKPAGINAFDPTTAQTYIHAGAAFVLVDADVALLARTTETLATRWGATSSSGESRASY